MAVRNSLLERFSGKFRRCWKTIPRFSGSAKCYPCQGLGTFRQGKRLLENWPLRDRHSLLEFFRKVWEENVLEKALSRKFLDPSKRASGLLCRGFLYRKNGALTPEGVENVPYEGGPQPLFGRGVMGGGKTGSICHFPFSLVCSVRGSQDTQMPGETARKMSLSHPLLCDPNGHS